MAALLHFSVFAIAIQNLIQLHVMLHFCINRSLLSLGVYNATGVAFYALWFGNFACRHLKGSAPKLSNLCERWDASF